MGILGYFVRKQAKEQAHSFSSDSQRTIHTHTHTHTHRFGGKGKGEKLRTGGSSLGLQLSSTAK